jgi:hypothetical protein
MYQAAGRRLQTPLRANASNDMSVTKIGGQALKPPTKGYRLPVLAHQGRLVAREEVIGRHVYPLTHRYEPVVARLS